MLTTATSATRASNAVIDTPLLPEEAAELLQITEDELLCEAERGTIPGVCLGDCWRFSRATLHALSTSRAA
ncbi:helix-turn-helix domain-containing protein [Saccharopolyspora sp. NPDC049357]|uniref:helix-turn-helix domain-containing protein n=1 Tax=Saccharopolyspora sp. NPDC049357 TaxID=3154507 RepID=UPI0034228EFD